MKKNNKEKILKALLEEVESSPVQDQPVQDQPVQDQPVQDQPVQDQPVQDQPVQDQPVQDQPVQDQPVQDQPVQDQPVQDQPIDTSVIIPDPVYIEPQEEIKEKTNEYNITSKTTSLALVRISDGLVQTFLRTDIPEGWKPPDGFTVVPDDQLPENWQKAPEILPDVPSTITATQIRLWLINNGISLNQISNLINQMPDSLIKSQIEVQWEYAPYVERNHPMINTLGAALGLTSEQIDQAFREAALL